MNHKMDSSPYRTAVRSAPRSNLTSETKNLMKRQDYRARNILRLLSERVTGFLWDVSDNARRNFFLHK